MNPLSTTINSKSVVYFIQLRTAGIAFILLTAAILPGKVLAQAPSIQYNGPQSYLVAAPITPLAPTSSNVGVLSFGIKNSSVGSGLNQPFGVALDASGNVYISNNGTGDVDRVNTGGTQDLLANFGPGYGIGVDGSGNAYVAANSHYGYVFRISPNGNQLIGEGFNSPSGVAVDISGNVYVADMESGQLYKEPINDGTVVSFGSFNQPTGVALDVYKNVYVVGPGTAYVKMFPANGHAPINIGSGLINAGGIAVDASGNMFVSDDSEIKMIPAGGGAAVVISSFYNRAAGLAVDKRDNIYICDANNNRVMKIAPTGGYYISPALPPGLSFNSATGVISGTPTKPVAARSYQVTAFNASGSKTVSLQIEVLANQANNLLASLTLSTGKLSPAFNQDTLNYTSYANTAQIKLTPKTSDPAATITINGQAVQSGTLSAGIPLAVGVDTIKIAVTAQNTVATRLYTLVVTRLPGTAANLTNLRVNSGTLSPVFSSSNIAYADTVGRVSRIVLTPVASYPGATITVQGDTVTSNTASKPIQLTGGNNVINVTVTAGDGLITKNYQLTVVRPAFLNVDSLNNIVMGTGQLSPVFSNTTLNYSTYINNAWTSLRLKPVMADAGETIATTVNGLTVNANNDGYYSAPLNVGSNTISFLVTAEDGVINETYTITVVRMAKNALLLSKLLVSTGTLSPSFSPNTYKYTDEVQNSEHTIKITATIASQGYLLKINGMLSQSGVQSPAITLNSGDIPTPVYVTVLSPDSSAYNAYNIQVYYADRGIPSSLGVASLTTVVTSIVVHQALSPNGDGINDHLQIDGLENLPENKLSIMDKSGKPVFEAKKYDNKSIVFDGHSSITRKMQPAGTYYYLLQYQENGELKQKSGYFVLKY